MSGGWELRCRGEWLFAPTNSARCPLPHQSRRGVLSRAAAKRTTGAVGDQAAHVAHFTAAFYTGKLRYCGAARNRFWMEMTTASYNLVRLAK